MVLTNEINGINVIMSQKTRGTSLCPVPFPGLSKKKLRDYFTIFLG